jgi:NAD(P)-dependent dehydrogenase (short-subunit alcohol dehydrogenase family)
MALMPTLVTQAHATVITITGGVAFVLMTVTPTYSATKVAIHSWSQSLRCQLRDTNVRGLEIAPPYVQSELFAPADATDPNVTPLKDFIDKVTEKTNSTPPRGQKLSVPTLGPGEAVAPQHRGGAVMLDDHGAAGHLSMIFARTRSQVSICSDSPAECTDPHPWNTRAISHVICYCRARLVIS